MRQTDIAKGVSQTVLSRLCSHLRATGIKAENQPGRRRSTNTMQDMLLRLIASRQPTIT